MSQLEWPCSVGRQCQYSLWACKPKLTCLHYRTSRHFFHWWAALRWLWVTWKSEASWYLRTCNPGLWGEINMETGTSGITSNKLKHHCSEYFSKQGYRRARLLFCIIQLGKDLFYQFERERGIFHLLHPSSDGLTARSLDLHPALHMGALFPQVH